MKSTNTRHGGLATINAWICKHARPDLKDKYGNIIYRPDGTPYKKSVVTLRDILPKHTIPVPVALAGSYILTSLFGLIIGRELIDPHAALPWTLAYFFTGLWAIIAAIIIIAYIYTAFLWIYIMLAMILNTGVGRCPNTAEPPES